MSIVAEKFSFVVGIDTHAKTHTFAIINSITGEEIANETFPVTVPGGRRALSWIQRRCQGSTEKILLTMEGTGSYGAKFRQQATDAGFQVTEAPFPERRLGRLRGKSDAIDAARAARATMGISLEKVRDPRAGRVHLALRVLTAARDSMSRERTAAINSLNALLRTVELGVDARKALSVTQIRVVGAWRERDEDFSLQISRREAVRLAGRIIELAEQLRQNHAELERLICADHPELLEVFGVGPVNAAIILTAWSHPGRVRSEAAFAALAGTCPGPASSGSTTRYRLNHGGDRQLNKAMYTIALSRIHWDQATKVYVAKRTSQGRTKKEIIRILKRYITRQLFRTLKTAGSLPTLVPARATSPA